MAGYESARTGQELVASLALDLGARFDDLHASLMGITGPQGIPGTNGTNGAQGIQGVKGDPGTNGTNGAPGTNGTNGAQGPLGTTVAYYLPAPQVAAANLIAGGSSLFNVSAAPGVLFAANTLVAGQVIELDAVGQLANASGAGATMGIVVKVGGAAFYATPTVSIVSAATVRVWQIRLRFVVMAAGAAAVVRGSAYSTISAGNARALVVATSDFGDWAAAPFATTSAVALDVQATSTVAGALTTGTLLGLSVVRAG